VKGPGGSRGPDAPERRPQLAAALAEARQRKYPIVVVKLDQLSRDVAIISDLTEQQVRSLSELGGDVDPFMLHTYAALTGKERRVISQRTKAALAEAKRRGVQLSGPVIGAIARPPTRLLNPYLPLDDHILKRADSTAGHHTRKGCMAQLWPFCYDVNPRLQRRCRSCAISAHIAGNVVPGYPSEAGDGAKGRKDGKRAIHLDGW
jgi:hypothetical protein